MSNVQVVSTGDGCPVMVGEILTTSELSMLLTLPNAKSLKVTGIADRSARRIVQRIGANYVVRVHANDVIEFHAQEFARYTSAGELLQAMQWHAAMASALATEATTMLKKADLKEACLPPVIVTGSGAKLVELPPVPQDRPPTPRPEPPADLFAMLETINDQ